jgi:hypothetical protein
MSVKRQKHNRPRDVSRGLLRFPAHVLAIDLAVVGRRPSESQGAATVATATVASGTSVGAMMTVGSITGVGGGASVGTGVGCAGSGVSVDAGAGCVGAAVGCAGKGVSVDAGTFVGLPVTSGKGVGTTGVG